MTRNLKALGLSLAAIFAISAMLASAAAATPRITSDEYPTTLKGEQTGVENVFILPGNRTVRCEEVTYEAEYTKAQSEAATWSISVVPTFKKCTATILGNVTPVESPTHVCYFTFTDEETKSLSTTEQTGSAHIKCKNAGEKFEIHVWTTNASHLADGTSLCTYTLQPQGPLKSITYKFSGTVSNPHTYITINANVSGIAVERSTGTLTNCGAASQTGELKSMAKVEMFNDIGQMIEGEMDPS